MSLDPKWMLSFLITVTYCSFYKHDPNHKEMVQISKRFHDTLTMIIINFIVKTLNPLCSKKSMHGKVSS